MRRFIHKRVLYATEALLAFELLLRFQLARCSAVIDESEKITLEYHVHISSRVFRLQVTLFEFDDILRILYIEISCDFEATIAGHFQKRNGNEGQVH